MTAPTRRAGLGYAVVDTETTGLLTGYRHRIAEIAVIHPDPDGTATREWCTLLNPQRDLGPQAIHGIRGADVRHAPTFDQIVGQLAGQVVVAHTWPFGLHDARIRRRPGEPWPLCTSAQRPRGCRVGPVTQFDARGVGRRADTRDDDLNQPAVEPGLDLFASGCPPAA